MKPNEKTDKRLQLSRNGSLCRMLSSRDSCVDRNYNDMHDFKGEEEWQKTDYKSTYETPFSQNIVGSNFI